MKTSESVKVVSEGLQDACGLLKAIEIKITFVNTNGVIPRISHILTISNYLVACLVINQLQNMIPICFRAAKYREVSNNECDLLELMLIMAFFIGRMLYPTRFIYPP